MIVMSLQLYFDGTVTYDTYVNAMLRLVYTYALHVVIYRSRISIRHDAFDTRFDGKDFEVAPYIGRAIRID